MISIILDPIEISLIAAVLIMLVNIQRNLGIVEAEIKDIKQTIHDITKEIDNLKEKITEHQFKISEIDNRLKQKEK